MNCCIQKIQQIHINHQSSTCNWKTFRFFALGISLIAEWFPFQTFLYYKYITKIYHKKTPPTLKGFRALDVWMVFFHWNIYPLSDEEESDLIFFEWKKSQSIAKNGWSCRPPWFSPHSPAPKSAILQVSSCVLPPWAPQHQPNKSRF